MDFEALAERPVARFFNLKGRGLEVIYSTYGASTLLVRQDGHDERAFAGSQIRVDDGPLGKLVTVHLSVIADGDGTSLSLVLPAVNLPASGSVSIGALAILTTHRNTLAGPGILDGALETYKSIALKGKASAGLIR